MSSYSLSEDESEGPSPVSSVFEEEIFHSQYIVLRTIGQGSHAKVMLAKHRLTGAPVAVKVLLTRKQWCEPVLSEEKIMRKTKHPNIISLLQVIETEKRVYLIMELAPGQQLYELIKHTGGLQEEEARAIFRQILSAVGYCHDSGIVHRDLKPDNIMITNGGIVKILDFGLGTQVKPGQKLNRHCGSYSFGAPELFLGLVYDGPKVDIWTLGVVLYYMVVGKVPFDAVIIPMLRKQVVGGRYHIPRYLSEELQDLLRLLLTVNPELRPTVNEVKSHPWFKKDKEFLPKNYEEMIPSRTDPAIVQAMEDMGFHAKDIKTSVIGRKFDETMASYCLLHRQAHQEDGSEIQAQPINPGVTPLPSLEDPATFAQAPRRRGSEPALCTHTCSSSNSEMSDWGRQADQRGGRHATAIPLHGPVNSTAHERPKSAPCLCSVSSHEEGPEDTRSHSSTPEDQPLASNPDPRGAEASSQGQHRGFRRWTRRIGDCLRRLCCCLPSRRRPRLGQNRVSPQE